MGKSFRIGRYVVSCARNGGLWCITWTGSDGATFTQCHGTKKGALGAAQRMDDEDKALASAPGAAGPAPGPTPQALSEAERALDGLTPP